MINTTPVDTWWNPGNQFSYDLAADAATRPALGALAALNAAGAVVSAAHATAVKVIGRADSFVAPTEGATDRVVVRRGVIALFNDATNPVDASDLYTIAHLGSDDATAATLDAEALELGPIVGLDEGRVFVQIDGVSVPPAVAEPEV